MRTAWEHSASRCPLPRQFSSQTPRPVTSRPQETHVHHIRDNLLTFPLTRATRRDVRRPASLPKVARFGHPRRSDGCELLMKPVPGTKGPSHKKEMCPKSFGKSPHRHRRPVTPHAGDWIRPILTPNHYMVPWSHTTPSPNSISIGSTISTQLARVSITQTRRPRYVRHL